MEIEIKNGKEKILECDGFKGCAIRAFSVKRNILKAGMTVILDGKEYDVIKDYRYGKIAPFECKNGAIIGQPGDFIGEGYGIYPLTLSIKKDEPAKK